jgi:hypothetical protein
LPPSLYRDLTYRAMTAGAEVPMSMLSTLANYHRDPTATLRTASTFGQGLLGSATRGFESVYRQSTGIITGIEKALGDLPVLGDLVGKFAGPIVRGLIKGGAVSARVGGLALQYLGPTVLAGAQERYQQIGELANLERPAEMLRALGGPNTRGNPQDPFFAMAARFGLRPAEALGVVTSGFRAAGGAPTMGAQAFLQADLAGLSPAGVGSFFGLGAAGSGGVGAVKGLQQLLGFASQEGLKGAKVEQLLTRIESHTGAVAERGGRLDLSDLAMLAFDLRATSPAFEGGQGVRGAVALSQLGGGALEQLTGNFAGLGEGALLAAAASEGGGIFEILKRLDAYRREPSRVPGAIGGVLGGAAPFAYLGAGFSPEQAEALGRGVTATEPGLGGFGANAGNLRLAPRLAEQEREILGIVASKPDVNERLIEEVTNTRKFMVGLGEIGADMILALRDLIEAIKDLLAQGD